MEEEEEDQMQALPQMDMVVDISAMVEEEEEMGVGIEAGHQQALELVDIVVGAQILILQIQIEFLHQLAEEVQEAGIIPQHTEFLQVEV